MQDPLCKIQKQLESTCFLLFCFKYLFCVQ